MQARSSSRFVLILILLLAFTGAFAQVRISSPYSRYGLGDIQGNHFSRTMAMGGIGYGLRDSLIINMCNPASYTSVDSLTFLCEVGLISNFSQLQTLSTTQGFNNMTSLGYLQFAFPVTRWWGAAIGLVPYSHTGYKLIVNDTVDGIGSVGQTYEGNGSLNRFFLGSGFKVHRDLSLGFNASFLFGTLNNVRSVYFPNLSYVFDTRITNTMVINDFHFETGLQYHHFFKKDYFLNAGLVYQIPWNMSGRKTYLVERFVTSSSGTETTHDSIDYVHNEKGKIHMPGGIGAGFTVGHRKSWMAGADVAWQNWGNYTTFGLKDSLKSNLKAAVGLMFTPKRTNVSSYFKWMTYRIGFRYENTYLNIHAHQINEYAVSAGVSFPFRKSGSCINLSFEFGQRGTTKDNLIKETFVNGILGLSIKEYWFFRRKQD
jgi:hypothetical protein